MAFRNRSANVSRFSMVPRPDIPRSVFQSEQTHKTTFDAGPLVPIYLDEILPGDSVRLNMTAFCRLATPQVPVMDNLMLDTFFFFVPNRLVWDHWENFMGEEESPGDSLSTVYQVPQIFVTAADAGYHTIYDYYGIPGGNLDPVSGSLSVNALFFRAYNLIWNEWFRDQNLNSKMVDNRASDGPDSVAHYFLQRRAKRHDYFTSALPWPQKPNGLDMTQGFGFKGGAPVSGIGTATLNAGSGGASINVYETGRVGQTSYLGPKAAGLGTNTGSADDVYVRLDDEGYPDVRVTINAMRQAFAVQRLLERDARGGTRYGELIRSHFGVMSPDARLQRPEYLGGGSTPIIINPIAQQSATGLTGSTTPLGQLGGVGTGVARGHGFSGSFTEHGMIIGLANVRADLTYQQGVPRMFLRKNKYEFYWPAFAHLGEQSILRAEIYATGMIPNDSAVFGYQERWAEYRHKPNRISGMFRAPAPAGQTAIDYWHLAERFLTAPVLGATFLESNPPVDRILAVGTAAGAPEFLFDSLFSVRMVRPIPAFSVPGLADHF